MRRCACLLLALLVSGCIAAYQDASRQTYSDIVRTFEALMAQLEAEAAACETDECRADVAARREHAQEQGRAADALQNAEFDPAEHDLMFEQIGSLKTAWDARAEVLLGDILELRAATHLLLDLDRRLLDEGDLLPLDYVDTLITQREDAAQSLIALRRDFDVGISNFVPAMRAAFLALDGSTQTYLGSQRLDIERVLVDVGRDASSMLALHIYTGVDASNQDESFIQAQHYLLAGDESSSSMLGYLDRIESSIKEVSTGLANAETALAGRNQEAGDRYRTLDAILVELEQMQSQSEANCLAVQ
jgi:hypothetical protein